MTTDLPNDPQSESRPAITCPKCASPMEKVTFQNIEVDRCTSCKGLWFDMLEREHLDALKGSESIDVGTPLADVASKKLKMMCPVCHTPMIRMVDLHNTDVTYESCQVCYGLFYDAGEFRQHKEHHVLGFFKGLFDRKK